MLTVRDVVRDLNLKVIAGEKGLDRPVTAEMLSRPGIELAGFTEYFDKERLILIGTKEKSFMRSYSEDIQRIRKEILFKENPPAVIMSVNVEAKEDTIALSNKYNVPLLKSSIRTTAIASLLYNYLHRKLAPRKSFHGTLVGIYGIGTMITGKSGIGKSETALELVKRGHILISDDRVDVYEESPNVLVGTAPDILKRYLEIRGIGIVDVVHMFGAGSYQESKQVKLIVELEHLDKTKSYDRLGLDYQVENIFGSEVVKITLPILPGRNIATLVESAALNLRLKTLGYDASKNLVEEVRLATKKGSSKDE